MSGKPTEHRSCIRTLMGSIYSPFIEPYVSPLSMVLHSVVGDSYRNYVGSLSIRVTRLHAGLVLTVAHLRVVWRVLEIQEDSSSAHCCCARSHLAAGTAGFASMPR